MKKIYLFIVCLLPMVAMAQPTITQSDLPVAGVAWLSAKNNSYSGAIGTAGANQTWDFSTLLNNSVDTTAFLSVTGTPYASTFPSANGATYDASNGNWQYFTSNSSGLYLDGGNQTGSFTIILNPPQLYFPVPFTYNNTNNSVARFVLDTIASGTPARYIINIQTNNLADAWGSLTLPNGTYPSVLREKITQTERDTLLIDPSHTGTYVLAQASASQKVSYQWVRHAAAGTTLLLGIDADSLGTTAHSSSYFLNTFVLSTHDLTIDNSSLHVYPNPASSNVHFNLEGMHGQNMLMKIYNSLGEEVISSTVKGTSYLDLPVNNLGNGIYYYTFLSDNDKRSGKFSVVH